MSYENKNTTVSINGKNLSDKVKGFLCLSLCEISHIYEKNVQLLAAANSCTKYETVISRNLRITLQNRVCSVCVSLIATSSGKCKSFCRFSSSDE